MFDSFKSKTGVKELFLTDGKPPYKQALPLALQHVVAMIVGCVTPAIIVAGIALSRGEISPEDKIVLVQGALIVAAVATLLQLISLKNKVGSGLPVIMGVSFAYLATMQAVVQEFDLATLFGAQLTGGIVAVIVGIFIKRIRSLFPPIVTGTVVFTIGLSLYPVAVGYMAGGTGSKDYGSVKNWAVALITLAVVVGLSHFTKGFLKLSAILIGICVGYVIAVILGMVDFSPVLSASWVQLPRPLHFGIKFEPSSMITMSILFVVNSVQAIGDSDGHNTGRPGQRTFGPGTLRRHHRKRTGQPVRCAVRRPSHSYLQPECRNRGNHEGCDEESILSGVRDHSGSRTASEDRVSADHDPSVCIGRGDHICICLYCHDRSETDSKSRAQQPEYGDRRSWSGCRNGHYTGSGFSCTVSVMGHDGFRKISGCTGDPDHSCTEPDHSAGGRKSEGPQEDSSEIYGQRKEFQEP